MKPLYIFASALLFFVFNNSAYAQNDKQLITKQLEQFLAQNSSKAIHDTFWANDLIYTSSSGKRFGKQTIMNGFKQAENQQETENSTKYSAESIDIRLYQETAVLAFTLVADNTGQITRYFNTGTFVKRNGQWQAVAWQATITATE
ncbi:nuclear transport factor 2 family protein [Thalassotalea marina]|uniref:DUF4440 domain-containing protein n=1 Tax=Thalassotalea marina TaxID=1673741 RepID=A0A919BCW7_9GAMM|nr:nuclear transport factor 2 family protein [Thalassotalea marina]GHF83299.1 hypothetical protein GCM10017161_08250 [Thalassotalea marina]